MKLFTKERRQERLKYYHTKTWRNIRAAQLRKQGLCELCYKNYRKLTVAVVCDHVIPWKSLSEFKHGPFQSLCKPCHDEKSRDDIAVLLREQKTKIIMEDV